MPIRLRLAPAPAGAEPTLAAPSPIGVILADDHALIRSHLRALLDREEDIEVLGEAADLDSTLRELRRHDPHVLVLDLRMPDGSGLARIGDLRARAPATGIVMLTMEESPALAQRALAVGALGYVLKELADRELAPAVRAAARGCAHLSPRVRLRPRTG
jgi:two-component system, NarL family, response regulator NreC